MKKYIMTYIEDCYQGFIRTKPQSLEEYWTLMQRLEIEGYKWHPSYKGVPSHPIPHSTVPEGFNVYSIEKEKLVGELENLKYITGERYRKALLKDRIKKGDDYHIMIDKNKTIDFIPPTSGVGTGNYIPTIHILKNTERTH